MLRQVRHLRYVSLVSHVSAKFLHPTQYLRDFFNRIGLAKLNITDYDIAMLLYESKMNIGNRDIIENSVVGEIHEDKNNDMNIRDVVRLYGCVDIDGKLNRVKTTVKRFKREGQQAYSYEVIEIEELEGTPEAETNQLPRTSNSSIEAAKLVINPDIANINPEKNSENLQGGEDVRFSIEGDGEIEDIDLNEAYELSEEEAAQLIDEWSAEEVNGLIEKNGFDKNNQIV